MQQFWIQIGLLADIQTCYDWSWWQNMVIQFYYTEYSGDYHIENTLSGNEIHFLHLLDCHQGRLQHFYISAAGNI